MTVKCCGKRKIPNKRIGYIVDLSMRKLWRVNKISIKNKIVLMMHVLIMIQTLCYEMLRHSSCSPDLALSYFVLYGR